MFSLIVNVATIIIIVTRIIMINILNIDFIDSNLKGLVCDCY